MHAGSAPGGQLAAGCVAMSGVTVQSLYSMSVPATLASRVCHAESAFIRRKDCTHTKRTPQVGLGSRLPPLLICAGTPLMYYCAS